MIANSMGIDRSAADGVDRSEANHCRTSPFVMAPIRRPQNRGRIWFFRYFRLTLRVPGFQVRECRRNAASAMSSNRESGEAWPDRDDPPFTISARRERARDRASANGIVSASPIVVHRRCPPLWACMK